MLYIINLQFPHKERRGLHIMFLNFNTARAAAFNDALFGLVMQSRSARRVKIALCGQQNWVL